MNDGTSVNCTGLINNPDISGLGVRISFYLQNFCLVVLVNRSWSDAPSALLTFVSTSCGLTIAAIIQAADKELSLFQAIQVSHLVWLANFGTYFALASLSRTSETSKSELKSQELLKVVKIAGVLQIIFSMSLTIYMWQTAHRFGNQAECNNYVKYVFFGHDVPALGRGRIAGLVSSSLLAVAYLFVMMGERVAIYTNRRRTPEVLDSDLPATMSSNSRNSQPPTPRYPPTATPSPSDATPERSGNRRPKSDPMLVGIIVVQVAVFVYLVTCTEKLIRHNRLAVGDTSATKWGFGQILSLALVVPSIVATIVAIHDQGIRRQHHRTI